MSRSTYAAYLNPQIPKPSEANELKRLTELNRDMVQLRYPAGLSKYPEAAALEVSSTSLFVAMIHPDFRFGGTVDEIGKFLSLKVVQ